MNTYTHLFSTVNALEEFTKALNIDYATDLLVQIYANRHDFSDLKHIHRVITTTLPNSHIIGAITQLNLSATDLSTSRTIISFTTFAKSSFRIFAYPLDGLDAISLAKDFVQNELTSLSKVAVIISNIKPIFCEPFISLVKEHAAQLIIAGGIIPQFETEKLFANERYYDNGIVGYVVDGAALQVNSFTNDYYMPIGRTHNITCVQDNLIKTIDHMPSGIFYEKYLGKALLSQGEIGYRFPLLIHSGGSYTPKPIIKLTDAGDLLTNTTLHSGDRFTLGYGNIRSLIDRNSDLFAQMNEVPAEALLVFSGLSRLISHEQCVHYTLNDGTHPISGVYMNTEFVTKGNLCQLSTGSLNILTLSEVMTPPIDSIEVTCHIDHTCLDEQMTLLYLVESTSKELNLLNETLSNVVAEKTNELLDHYYLDDLTKLPNQNKLREDLLKNEISALALMDISSFVSINNFYGNYIGNKLLTELSKLIAAYCYEHNYVTYRIHSDIFAIANGQDTREMFNSSIQSLQSIIHKHCFMELSLEIYITTVMAISHHEKHLYENTGMTLEFAKGQKMPFLIYDQTLNIEEAIKNNLVWTSKIRNAIEKDRIVPYYQPIYNNTTHETDHYEVLMRLIDEDGTVFTPIYFLGIAKKANLYKSLTKIIIDKAFKNFENSDLKFSINLSSEDILDKNTRQFIYEKLQIFPKSHHVIFEIVESEGIENYDDVKEFINVTKSYGVKIAIDDFGTGFSNFHYLFKLDVDLIKIDGSIIQQINGERAATLVAETIVDFCRKMGIATVAEFVSDEEIFNKTNELGINYSQGYFVSHPQDSTNEQKK